VIGLTFKDEEGVHRVVRLRLRSWAGGTSFALAAKCGKVKETFEISEEANGPLPATCEKCR